MRELQGVEAQLNKFVEMRARQAKHDQSQEELWLKSSRVARDKRRKELAAEWYDYHCRQLSSNEQTRGFLDAYHRKERAKYARVLGISTNEQEEA
jgi:hypothetical protein